MIEEIGGTMSAMNQNPEPRRQGKTPRVGTSWVWALPSKGIEWCDCGGGHELTREVVWSIAHELRMQRCLELTYAELMELAMAVWRHVAVCSFFQEALNRAIIDVYGRYDRHYPIGAALDIVGYLSKNWQGCPENDFQA